MEESALPKEVGHSPCRICQGATKDWADNRAYYTILDSSYGHDFYPLTNAPNKRHDTERSRLKRLFRDHLSNCCSYDPHGPTASSSEGTRYNGP